LISISATALCLVGVGSSAASADTQGACAGDTETLTWTPPTDTSEFISYQIQGWSAIGAFVGRNSEFDVGLDQTSAEVTLGRGDNFFYVYASTTADPQAELLSSSVSGSTTGGYAPVPMFWNGGSVGDGTANVTFMWPGGIAQEQLDGFASTQETISGAGQAFTLGGSPATATFTGLTNGQPYTFTGDTFNECGDSGIQTSPTYVPGISPVWTADTPPRTSHPGEYSYRFRASGKPAPTYQLLGAPSWLHLQPNGSVDGVIPHGTTSFSYSVTAYNGVGISSTSPVPVGPFTITVKS
jgi:hypothetical protein